MTVLVTGHLGYIGSVLTGHLARKGIAFRGLDSGLYREAAVGPVNDSTGAPLRDLRKIDSSDLAGVDTVIHMGALSNDPLGELSPNLTTEINYEATVRLAEIAQSAGVRRFVFMSTQSVYGISTADTELDEVEAVTAPETAYAKTKLLAEEALRALHSEDFFCVILRPATVYGYSPRLRTDIVFNNLLAQAFFLGNISLKSDGLPWRPVVHIKDLCDAIESAAFQPAVRLRTGIYNVGVRGGNYRVIELAEKARSLVPGTTLSSSSEPTPDERSYRVSFERIYEEMGFSPSWTLEAGGRELIKHWSSLKDRKSYTLDHRTNRLEHLRHRIEKGTLDGDLYVR